MPERLLPEVSMRNPMVLVCVVFHFPTCPCQACASTAASSRTLAMVSLTFISTPAYGGLQQPVAEAASEPLWRVSGRITPSLPGAAKATSVTSSTTTAVSPLRLTRKRRARSPPARSAPGATRQNHLFTAAERLVPGIT